MKKIIIYFIVLITVFTSACKKKNDPAPLNNNEVNATVVISPTSTITINAKGTKAKMACSILGGGTFIEGTHDNGAAVYINISNPPALSCITSPGTYNFSCEYRKNVADPNTPIWSNIPVNGGTITNRGSITLTVANDHYGEGYFNAVSKCASPGCAYGVDSVIITGTFKGSF